MARRSTAVLATAALIVLAVMAVFAIELSNTQAKSKQDVEARVHERGALAAALIDSLVQSTLGQVHQYETTFGGPTVSRSAVDAARAQGGYVAVLDASGRRVLASSVGFTAQARHDLATSAALALVRAGRPYGVGNVLPYGRTGVVDLAVPFPTRYGTRILITGFSPLALGGLLAGELQRIPGVKGAHNYLLDARLTVIASTNPARPPGYRFTDPASVAALSRVAGDRNGHYYDETRLTNSTWRVVLSAPDGPLFASVSGLHKWIPWIILVAFALMAAAALMLGARTLRSAEGRLTASEREALNQRHHLEQQITQMRKLESLGQLAGGVAHDFNNLLGVILNYAQFVGEDVSAAVREDADRWGPVAADVTEIERAAQRATALTRQLLAFARREAIHPDVINLNDIVEETEQLLRRTLGEHIVLRCELAGDLAPVLADPGQIGQVLINLAVNGRDAMPDGGTLSIETANAEVDLSYASARPELAPGQYVRIRVSDTGVGMDADTLEHAFEPFFTTKAEGEGTGLGLATIYGIVTQSGGRIRMYSERGSGTTCTIMLPATTREASARARPTADERGGRGEVILMVEDEDGIREVARRILTRCGYTVLTAASGPDALELAEQHEGDIDLLMTDVIMPRMLGKEVAVRIQAARPNVHVMFMSGYAQPVLDANANVPEGMVLLEKPFTEQGLLAKVRVALSSPGAA